MSAPGALPPQYPLAAVAHQPDLLLALSLLAVAPAIGGLLIRGDRGAAKSTAARGLAALLPPGPDGPAPFVNLPLGATEDRVIGTLDLPAALRGEVRLRSGLLAQADGGLLYIDEVNLLPDHLVDLLLDAAATGVVRVQRDTLSAEQPARFALIGSMNPEEGPLRPQFLDRFGLCVDVHAPHAGTERAEIIRRRMAFEADPAAFTARWAPAGADLAAQLHRARALLPAVQVPDALLDEITALSAGAGVRSLRADLVLYRAARACCALDGREHVTSADLHRVAPLVLRHRPRDPQGAAPPPRPPAPTPPPPPSSPPTDAPSPDYPAPDDLRPNDLPPDEPTPGDPTPDGAAPPDPQGPGSTSGHPTPAPEDGPVTVSGPTASATPLELHGDRHGQRARGRQGPLSGAVAGPTSGPAGPPARLHVPATLRATLTRGDTRITPEDLRVVRPGPAGRQVLFVADASGSVGASGRMGTVKGALLDVLGAQGRGDRVALITFRATGADLTLDWTADRAAAEAAVRGAPTGGRTPLAHALTLAAQVLGGQRGAELVLLTDGRCNVPLTPGADPWTDALHAAAALRGIPSLVVDTETGHVRLGRAAQLA